jgi:hypothetical protein
MKRVLFVSLWELPDGGCRQGVHKKDWKVRSCLVTINVFLLYFYYFYVKCFYDHLFIIFQIPSFYHMLYHSQMSLDRRVWKEYEYTCLHALPSLDCCLSQNHFPSWLRVGPFARGPREERTDVCNHWNSP